MTDAELPQEILAELTWLRQRCSELQRAEAERQAMEEALQLKTAQLEAINATVLAFLGSGKWGEASARLLRVALDQTASEYGFIGVQLDGPVLRILAHEGIVWDNTMNREFYDKAVRTYQELGYLELTNLENLFGRVVTTGKVVLSNDPRTDTRSGELLPAHPPLRHFLGVPILEQTKVVGMIGVANRPGGYTEVQQRDVEFLTQVASVLYDGYLRHQREAQLERQLRQSVKMEAIGRLAGGVAHDFNNMLAVITGYSEVLMEGLKPDHPLYSTVEQIKRAGERAAELTDQLLAFSRQQIQQTKVLNLNLDVQNIEKMLKRLIGENIQLTTRFAPDLGLVKADPGQIGQVLMNLVVNARDAMPQGGQLFIETANVDIDPAFAARHAGLRPGSYVMLEVSDTGCGMDAETRAHIFEPFFTTKEPGKGTGLGLSTVYGIVKQSGGYILVESELGNGAAFKIYLPRVEGVAPTSMAAPSLKTTSRGKETILLVEDEEIVRTMIFTLLSRHGYQILETSNGEDALRTSDRYDGHIHLLLTDVIMPGENGYAVASKLRARRPELKVLFMSGHMDSAIVQKILSDPRNVFLRKPFNPSALAQKVREVLEGAQSQ